MVIDVLLISDGSWLVPRTAEKATFAPAERTEMPSEEVTPPSEDGFESHTTRHFPSRTMGSVSFWPRQKATPHPKRSVRASMAQGPGQRTGTMVGSLSPSARTDSPLEVCYRTRSTGPDLLLSPLRPFLSLSSSLCGALSLSQTPSDTQTHSHRLRLPSLLRVLVDFEGVFRRLWFEILLNEDANRDEVSYQTTSEKPL